MSNTIRQDEWQAELDRLESLSPAKKVTKSGFTVIQFASRRGISRRTARDQIADLDRMGRLVFLGYRPNRREKVYGVTK